MTHDSKAIVAGFFAAAAAHDQQRIAAILDPGVVVVEAAALPYGGRHVGIDAFRALVRRVFRLWSDTQVEVRQLIGDGDVVVVLATLSARSKADGKAFSMPIAEVWQLRNGRVIEIQPFYFDTHALLGTVAAEPPATPN